MKKLIFVLVFFVLSLNLFGQSYYGKILRLNTNGAMGWEDINSVLDRAPSTDTNHSFWLLEGNTLSSNEFIGTKNSFDLIFKTNNAERLRIAATGDISILNNINLTNNGTAKQLRFYESIGSGANYTALQAQTQEADITYTLPAVAGTNGQVLSTDGSGNLSWASVSDNNSSNELITAHSYTAGSKLLRITEDGVNWDVTLPTFSTASADAGLVAGSNGQTTYFLRGDNSWQPVDISNSNELITAHSYTAGSRQLRITEAGTNWDVTLPTFSTTSADAGLLAGSNGQTTYFLRGDNTWQPVDISNSNELITAHSYTAGSRQLRITEAGANWDVTLPTFSTANTEAGLVAGSNGQTTSFLRGDNTWQPVDISNSNELITAHSYAADSRLLRITEAGANWDVTLPTFSTTNTDAGLVAGSNGQTAYFLRGDNTWQPVDISNSNELITAHSYTAGSRQLRITEAGHDWDVTLPTFSTASADAGLVAGSNEQTAYFLRGDNTWQPVITSESDPLSFHQSGNSFGVSAVLGTTDDYGLIFKTNKAERLQIAATGEITILNNVSLTNSGSATQLRFYEPSGSGTHYTALQAQTQAGDITYTLPATAGTSRQVLSTDGSGSLSWITDSTGWGLKGNSGTVEGTNFIGTTDDKALNFKVNSQKAGRIGTSADGSVFLGYQAGANDDLSSNQNVFVGYQAGYSNTTGYNNTANGTYALYSNTAGYNNTADGFAAFNSNTTGYNNTAIGTTTLNFNSTGYNNTANGNQALYSNTTGFENTANGNQALYYNTTGSNNVALGDSAGRGAVGINFNQCTFIGANSYPATYRTNVTMLGYGITNAQCTGDNQVILGNSNVTGFYVGTGSLTTTENLPNMYYDNTTGQIMRSTSSLGGTGWGLTGNTGTVDGTNFIGTNDNVALSFKVNSQKSGRIGTSADGSVFLGYQAGANDDLSDNKNVFVGYQAGYSNTNGYNNTANGTYALYSNTTGVNNTANGTNALYSNTTGYNNTANGTYALYLNTLGYYNTANGSAALDKNTTGNNNTANGSEALYNNTIGGYNTANGAGALFSNVAGSNATAIGYQAMYYANNTSTAFNNNNVAVGYRALYGSTTPGNNTGNYNTAVGYMSLYSNTSGQYNTANGLQALYLNTTGMDNTANGSLALTKNTTGSGNTADGTKALSSNIDGGYNTANGSNTLYSNTSGYYNTANGSNALYSNTTGNYNTANGSKALYYNTTGGYNTANGPEALYNNTEGGYNTANGVGALYSNRTGSNATAIGYQAMYYANNTSTGFFSSNVAVGYRALYGSTTPASNTGNFNTAVGYVSLYSNTSGQYNTANGYQAMYYNTTGYENTANGTLSLYYNTSGGSNTANGNYSLFNNSTGSYNVALGDDAGYGAWGVNFNQCTFVGANSFPTTARTNVTMLGYGIADAQCTGDNQVLLGNTSITQIRAQVGSITTYSDGRYKTNIENNVHGLDFIMRLKPITYSTDPRKLHKIWGTADSLIEKMDVSDAMSKRYIGFIAQDVEQAANDCGFAFPGIDVPKNEKEAYTLRYVDFIMPMVKSIQEQQKMIEQLQTENKELKTENQEMKLKIDHITQLEQENQLLQNQMATMMQEIEKIKQEMANKDAGSNNNQEIFGEKK